MTRKQFVEMIAYAESSNQLRAVGDNGLAGGLFNMHWDWRKDFWPDWAWETLALLDRWAVEYFISHDHQGKPRRPATARVLADLFNAGHATADPAYDARCLRALDALGVTQDVFDTIVE